ncbi:hypothetical protein ACQ5JZ_07235 [Streptomyces sp. ZG43]
MREAQSTDGNRPLLLVVATGMRTYREYLLRSIGREFDVHLFHVDEPTWEREYISGWTVLPTTLDGAAMAEAARALHAATPVAGVLCWDEGRIHAASYVAEALGLRNGDPDVVWPLSRSPARPRSARSRRPWPRPTASATPSSSSPVGSGRASAWSGSRTRPG